MKIQLRGQSEEFRSTIRYGVKGCNLFYIPYTGWGNTVTTKIYEQGEAVLKPVRTDSQWASTGDADPDGEVFTSLAEAERHYESLGYTIRRKVSEVSDSSAVGGFRHQ